MIYTVKINNTEYEVEVERGKANILKTTELAPQEAPVLLTAPVPSAAPVQVPAAVSSSVAGDPIKAPMPGSIMDIKVSLGSRVKKGDLLLVLEAMKMENELVSPYDGVVTQVSVSKDTSVSTGEVLLYIEKN